MKNKQRIEALEKRVQALEDGVATTGYCQPAEGVNNPSYTLESDGKCIVNGGEIISINANTTINPTYPIQSTHTDPNLITDWLEKNGNPEIEAKVEFPFSLESVKHQVTEMLKQTELPDWAEWVSVDDDGTIWYQKSKPKAITYGWSVGGEVDELGEILVNGADWKQCVWKISDLLEDKIKTITSEDIATIEVMHDALLENHAYDINCRMLKNARKLTSKLNKVIENE